ncbi:unnamed protein product [Ixodes hexagonus]
MCEFALYRFADGSLTVGLASMIRDYDPAVHNSDSWPLYEGSSQASQATNFVIVYRSGDGRMCLAQAIQFSEDRHCLDKFRDLLIEGMERASAQSLQKKTNKKRKVNSMEDEVPLRLQQEIKDEQASNFLIAEEGSEDLPLPATAAVASPPAEHITRVISPRVRLARAERAREAAEKRATVAEEREKTANERLGFLWDELWPKLQEIPTLLEAVRALTSTQSHPVQPETGSGGCSFGGIVLPAVRFVRLRGKSPAVYTQELAEMVFGKETLAGSSLNGSVGGKKALCKAAVDDILGNAVQSFPAQTTASVRQYLRRKCSNASTASKKNC